MKKILKNVLIFGATSDMAMPLTEKLLEDKVNVYAVSRSYLKINSDYLYKYNCDLTKEEDINSVFKNFDVKFDAVLNFQGVAISSPIENLKIEELEKQYKISIYSLVSVLKNLKGKLYNDAVIVNLSSMAAFGMFPFLAPYETAKAAADIILNCYEMETGIKTVSIKAGVVSTKFWESSVELNMENFDNFKDEYEEIGRFLKINALKNANKGTKPEKVSDKLYKIIYSKNPPHSVLIGRDANFISILSHFKSHLLFSIIRKALELRVRKVSS